MPADSSKPQSTSDGHRERLRRRFLAGESGALEDVALLELLLSYAIVRRDVQPLAKALISKFGSAAAVLAADREVLQKVSGIKESAAVLIKLAHHLASGGTAVPSLEKVPAEHSGSDPLPASLPESPPGAQDATPPLVATSEATAHPKPIKRTEAPKLQVSNGYAFDPAQNARLLTYIFDHPQTRRFARSDMMEGTGLAEGQIESLTSIGAAMGLITPTTGVLTPFGRLVHQHDLFLDSPVSLEFCHCRGASNPRNLIWHTVFNELLPGNPPTDQAGWAAWLREKLADSFSQRSLVKHVAAEVRFILDAYTVKNFKKLSLLIETPDKTLTLRRYTALNPLTLAAITYWIGEQHEARLVSFSDLHAEPGSPGRVFGLDASSLRQMVEVLQQKGWIRYEVRHGLDQIRLIDGFQPLEFLSAAYEGRDPEPLARAIEPEPERLLL